MKSSNSRPQLLVIKPSSLGDIVHALQVIASLKEQNPEVCVSWVVRDIFQDVVRSSSCVDHCIIYHRNLGMRGLWRCCRDICRLGHFDWVWDMQGLFRSGLMTFAAKSKVKIGRYDARECAGIFYDRCIPPPGTEDKFSRKPKQLHRHHAVDILREFLPTIGAKRACALPHFHLRINGKKLPPHPYIMIAPESRGPHKNWPHYEKLTISMCRLCPWLNVVWVGLRKNACPSLAMYRNFTDLQGKTSLLELMTIVKHSQGVIANDSGCLHLAVAMDRPALGIFTSTDPLHSGPRAIGNSIALSAVNPCPYFPELEKFFFAALRGEIIS
ncbi:MAG: glycosyltransferase family 9 protein [Puniceicoccales bacterium]|jgi:ADP-heptose:LPS heptosyltransferase|nr:glycosyltransferase family 9 protein [Puniceicoccales bacterium]